MAELLITSADFAPYRSLNNVDYDTRVLPSVYRVQRGYIRDLLGDAMYYDLWNNQEAAKYVSLLDGGTYIDGSETKQLFGLKAVIVLYTYATFINNNDFRVTRAGNKEKVKSESNTVGDERLQKEISLALQEAEMYAKNVTDFINASGNAGVYPLYSPKGSGFSGGVRIGLATQQDYPVVR